MVGSSGMVSRRLVLVTASIFTLPSLACGRKAPPSKIRLTRPLIRSGSAVVVPLYGTCTMSRPARDLRISIDSNGVPTPEEP